VPADAPLAAEVVVPTPTDPNDGLAGMMLPSQTPPEAPPAAPPGGTP
jgi:hypothetical protein